jgi:TolB-like protein
VGRDDLKQAVWGGDTHVDFDRGLAYCLSQIRAALRDSGENPRFVQTLPKRGYRFIAPVIHSNGAPVGGESMPGQESPVARHHASKWIAVGAVLTLLGAVSFMLGLPTKQPPRIIVAVSVFDNESGRPQYDRLVAGLSDLVVTRLTEMAETRMAVVGNAAVLRQPRNLRNLKAVQAGVHADYVILGQLQEAGTGLRFITHLIRLSDETHLKAARFPLPDGDVSNLEDAVVAEFEGAIRDHVLK